MALKVKEEQKGKQTLTSQTAMDGEVGHLLICTNDAERVEFTTLEAHSPRQNRDLRAVFIVT